jgi:hypothetical protein
VFLQEPAGLVGLIALLVAVWGVRVGHGINNWTYAIITLGILAIAPGVMAVIAGQRVKRTAPARATATIGGVVPALAAAGNGHSNGYGNGQANGGTNGDGRRLSGPLEWLGINQPFQPADVAAMNEALALPSLGEGAARGAS